MYQVKVSRVSKLIQHYPCVSRPNVGSVQKRGLLSPKILIDMYLNYRLMIKASGIHHNGESCREMSFWPPYTSAYRGSYKCCYLPLTFKPLLWGERPLFSLSFSLDRTSVTFCTAAIMKWLLFDMCPGFPSTSSTVITFTDVR